MVDRRSGAVDLCRRALNWLERHLRAWSADLRRKILLQDRLGIRAANCGSTSSTTWYWLSWVKMVETCRWPKAS